MFLIMLYVQGSSVWGGPKAPQSFSLQKKSGEIRLIQNADCDFVAQLFIFWQPFLILIICWKQNKSLRACLD